jgi:uncharacterized membrane protein YfcA
VEFLGYICATLVGISLGILGSGGSILTVPIMVYLMNINPVDATGLSLFIVGVTSGIGGFTYVRKKLVDIQAAAVFALPSIICVFLTRKFFIPAIPDPVISISSFIVSKEIFILILFSLLMITVGNSMIRNAEYKETAAPEPSRYNYSWLLVIGIIAGFLTGFLGVGGGFIIIPALVLFAKIPVRMSVGTSLLIISVNSFSGFAEEVIAHHASINYKFLFLFSFLSVIGIFIGFFISMKLNAAQLKRIFGWVILVMGVCVFVKEIFFRM